MSLKNLYTEISLATDRAIARGKRIAQQNEIPTQPAMPAVSAAMATAIVVSGVPTLAGAADTLLVWFSWAGLEMLDAKTNARPDLSRYTAATYARVIAIHRRLRGTGAHTVRYSDAD